MFHVPTIYCNLSLATHGEKESAHLVAHICTGDFAIAVRHHICNEIPPADSKSDFIFLCHFLAMRSCNGQVAMRGWNERRLLLMDLGSLKSYEHCCFSTKFVA